MVLSRVQTATGRAALLPTQRRATRSCVSAVKVLVPYRTDPDHPQRERPERGNGPVPREGRELRLANRLPPF
jgi:hypothetical protein